MISEPELVGGEPAPPRKERGGRFRGLRRPGPAPASAPAADPEAVPPGHSAWLPAPAAAWDPGPRGPGATWGGPPGGVDADPDGDGEQGTPVVVGDTLRAKGPRRVALAWGVGGALAASAAWTVGLYALHAAGPDLHGYHASGDLCADARLTALERLLGTSSGPQPASSESPAAGQYACEVQMGPAPRDSPVAGPQPADGPALSTRSVVDVSYVLHRRTDPGPEFDATLTTPALGYDTHPRRVPGLGERAYVVEVASGGPEQLKVLDGQAVLSIQVTSYTDYEHPPGGGLRSHQYLPRTTDPGVLEPALVSDMMDLMVRLRR